MTAPASTLIFEPIYVYHGLGIIAYAVRPQVRGEIRRAMNLNDLDHIHEPGGFLGKESSRAEMVGYALCSETRSGEMGPLEYGENCMSRNPTEKSSPPPPSAIGQAKKGSCVSRSKAQIPRSLPTPSLSMSRKKVNPPSEEEFVCPTSQTQNSNPSFRLLRYQYASRKK